MGALFSLCVGRGLAGAGGKRDGGALENAEKSRYESEEGRSGKEATLLFFLFPLPSALAVLFCLFLQLVLLLSVRRWRSSWF